MFNINEFTNTKGKDATVTPSTDPRGYDVVDALEILNKEQNKLTAFEKVLLRSQIAILREMQTASPIIFGPLVKRCTNVLFQLYMG